MIAALSTLAFALPVYLTLNRADDALIDQHFAADVESFIAAYQVAPAIAEVERSNFQIYVAPQGDTAAVPATLLALEADDDELEYQNRLWDVRIVERDGTRFYFLFDETDVENFEMTLLGVILAAGTGVTLLAMFFGARYAARVSRPLSELAQFVGHLDETAPAPFTIDDKQQPYDEVLILSRAIEGYHARIAELLQREREFSSDVSHELRTPLMAIYGAAEVLSVRGENAHNPSLAAPVARIKRGCVQMSALTEALLYLARDPGSFDDMLKPIDLSAAIDEQVATLDDLANQKGVAIGVDIVHATPITAIPAVVDIVIGNILKNAIKYTTGERISVRLRGRELVIEDYGPGMEAETAATVFDRFARGRDKRDGIGIGLALVRRFCDEYGWRLYLHSARDFGTRVAVEF